MSDDYVVQVVERFCSLTGKMICSPADFAVATDWELAGVPLSIVLATIDEWAAYNAKRPWLRKSQLDWLRVQVEMAFRDWKRAVGPQYGKVS